MKMLLECRAGHVLGVICGVKCDADINIKLGRNKAQGQVK